MDYYHTKLEVDGVPVDLLLTEGEVKKASERALKYPEKVSWNENTCWPVECRDTKCSLLKWIMGKCCECGECE